VDACNFCVERVDEGLQPWCVERCIGHAMIFGDLDDPASEVSKGIKRTQAKPLSPESGTRPKVYYASLDVKPEIT
jgi:Fe-S-cluster-containing dehydrogenase component